MEAEEQRLEHLKLIRKAAKARARKQASADQADELLRQLIREGFAMGIPGSQMAKESGLSIPRTYQIRNGRR